MNKIVIGMVICMDVFGSVFAAKDVASVAEDVTFAEFKEAVEEMVRAERRRVLAGAAVWGDDRIVFDKFRPSDHSELVEGFMSANNHTNRQVILKCQRDRDKLTSEKDVLHAIMSGVGVRGGSANDTLDRIDGIRELDKLIMTVDARGVSAQMKFLKSLRDDVFISDDDGYFGELVLELLINAGAITYLKILSFIGIHALLEKFIVFQDLLAKIVKSIVDNKCTSALYAKNDEGQIALEVMGEESFAELRDELAGDGYVLNYGGSSGSGGDSKNNDDE